MINEILIKSCLELQRRIQIAHKKLSLCPMIPEAAPCYKWVCDSLDEIKGKVTSIQSVLMKGFNNIYLHQTWYSELSNFSNRLSFLDHYYLDALNRLKVEDRLALRLLHWLHTSHEQTKDALFIVSNGSFSVAASKGIPTLYFLPVTSEASFLHLPLFFHEFGHKLFVEHKEELEALISELQLFLKDELKPIVSQDDEKYKKEEDRAVVIAETWREWMEEFFCDAVGLNIGGPSYLYAFSLFTLMGGIKEFSIPERQLSKRSHPVTYLRIRFLADRARALGWATEADKLEREWYEIASMLDIREDYFGFYDVSYKDKVTQILNDMLTEANPQSYNTLLSGPSSVLSTIDKAWNMYHTNQTSFETWEDEAVELLIAEMNC